MNSKKALQIAKEFLATMNPTMWDGNGNEPKEFNQKIWNYNLSDTDRLDISFEYDNEDGWITMCELVDIPSNEMYDILSSYGIDSPQNLADTIETLAY